MTPSKRLTDVLSTYLDFDGKQLKLGLWGGDLKIQDVNLKNDAFYPLLNTWKANDGTTGLDIASFLTKEALIGKGPSYDSTLDLKLMKGTIGYFRARVPWKNLLLGAGDDTVHVDLRDVTIRLRLESCIGKELDSKNGGLSKLYSQQQQKGAAKYSRLHGDERRWKQEMIRIAEQCVKNGQDIPSPAEFLKRRAEFIGKESSDAKDIEKEDKASFLERFVRSFASSLGWRIGQGLKVSMSNIQIIMVQDGVEVGLLTEAIELYEYKYSQGDDESVSVVDEPDGDMPNSAFNSESKGSSSGPHAGSGSGDSIRKQMKVSNCGVFLRTVSEFHEPSVDPALDEYIIQPTNATVSMCLRKTALSVNVDQMGKDAEFMDDDSQTADGLNEDDDSIARRKKPRRGKREKRRKLSEDSESCSILKEVGAEPDTNLEDNKHSSSSVSTAENASLKRESESQSSFEGIDFEESSALVSTKIQMDKLVVVTTTRSLRLLNNFVTRVSKIKGGRPSNDLGTFLDGDVEKKLFARQWWRYTCFCVLKDVRRRRVLVDYFAQTGESFNSSAQYQFRQKYIEAYSKLRIGKAGRINDFEPVNEYVGSGHQEDGLKRMEDSLPVEQIMLYRALARSEKVRSGTRLYSGSDADRRRIGPFSLDRKVSFSELDNSNHEGSQRSIYSFESAPTRQPKHRSSRSSVAFPLLRAESGNLTKVPKHQRNQSLNLHTMSQALDHIPSPRHQRYASSDLSSILENRSFEETGVAFKANLIEAMRDFDSAINQSRNVKAGEPNANSEASNSIASSNMNGSVALSMSFILSEFKFFICQENSHDQSGECVGDEVSILTISTVGDENYGGRGSGVNNSGLTIFGSPHAILLSSVLYKTKLSSYKDLGRGSKVKAFSIDGAFCRVRETNIMSSGRVVCCIAGDKNIPPSDPRRVQPQSIGELSDYQVCWKNQTGVPFMRGKLSIEPNETLPKKLQISFARIASTVDVLAIGNVANFVRAGYTPVACEDTELVPMSEYDLVRYDAARHLEESIGGKDIDLHVECGGFELIFPVSSVDEDAFFLPSCGRANCSIRVSLRGMVFRQGSYLSEDHHGVSHLKNILADYPSTSFQNTVSGAWVMSIANIIVPFKHRALTIPFSRLFGSF